MRLVIWPALIDDTRDPLAEGVGTLVLHNRSETWYEEDGLAMLACESDWVFTINTMGFFTLYK